MNEGVYKIVGWFYRSRGAPLHIHVTSVARGKPNPHSYARYANLRLDLRHKSLIYIYIFFLLLLLLLILLYVTSVTVVPRVSVCFFLSEYIIAIYGHITTVRGSTRPFTSLQALPRTTLSYAWAKVPHHVTTTKIYLVLLLTTCVSRHIIDST